MASKKKRRQASNNKKPGLGDLGNLLGDQLPPGDDSLSDFPQVDVLDPLRSPLQVLNRELFRKDKKGNELANQVLEETAKAEQESCQQLYTQLCERTELLADETITVQFPWRLRVGGTRGFRELVLPVFHPVYGIPYVPSSSLKGFLRAWARKAEQEEFKRLLGFIDGEHSSLAAVQVLDAFPIRPCLKLDMANPQWAWDRDQVVYSTVPHPLLSMANVTLKIGLVRTSLGTALDVQKVKGWLEQAFEAEGLGARVSAGYGQATRINGNTPHEFSSLTHPHGSEHSIPFEFWSEGIHGADTRNNVEFRPVAVRGVLRYWFRAVGLGLYTPVECRTLEQKLFGGIEPEPKEGSFKLISVLESEEPGTHTTPHHGTGKLILQTKKEEHLVLLQALLRLAFHIGGVGRGARRPLHRNSGRMRGCFWQSTVADERLPYDAQAWQDFLKELLTAFEQVPPITAVSQSQRSQPVKKRTQDIFNRNARIYLVPSPNLKHPSQVQNWSNEGDKHNVRGTGLEFFYKSGFKGKNREGQGNPQVGGELGVPSYVWIQANGLDTPAEAYQVITVFGIDHPERERFLQAVQDSNQLKGKIEITLPWS